MVYELQPHVFNNTKTFRTSDMKKAADGDVSQIFEIEFTKTRRQTRTIRNGPRAGETFELASLGVNLNGERVYLEMNDVVGDQFDKDHHKKGQKFALQRRGNYVHFKNMDDAPVETTDSEIKLPDVEPVEKVEFDENEQKLIKSYKPLKDKYPRDKLLSGICDNLKKFGNDESRAEAIYAAL